MVALSQQILMKDYSFEEAAAARLLMLPAIIVCFVMSIIGIVADKYGRR